MGKSQSKLSPEQLSDLQKNTYCESSQPDPLVLCHQLTPITVDKRELQQWYTDPQRSDPFISQKTVPQVQGLPQGLSLWPARQG